MRIEREFRKVTSKACWSETEFSVFGHLPRDWNVGRLMKRLRSSWYWLKFFVSEAYVYNKGCGSSEVVLISKRDTKKLVISFCFRRMFFELKDLLCVLSKSVRKFTLLFLKNQWATHLIYDLSTSFPYSTKFGLLLSKFHFFVYVSLMTWLYSMFLETTKFWEHSQTIDRKKYTF